uniref:Uncharacterized protein n=1 Tax=Plectus sambesii TaxID=2011161 RepID=A0A914VIN2_9BILA
MADADVSAGKSSSKPDVEENGETTARDCHEVVKSSGIGSKRGNLCGEHQYRMHRRSKVSVACQTDESELYSSLGPANCSKANSESSPRKDDSSKPEGTLRLMIQNFRNMTDTVRGPGKSINGVPWKIMVMPRQHVVQKKGTQKCLGFFLQCCPDAYSDSWSCQAAAELRLISQKPGVPNFTRKTNHVYTAKENDWGYSCFMTWADILDESQGYIKDDKVILEVYVKAEPPKNVLTHDQFEKKIQDYMRLADMQSSRGLIDKAIEVNQSALKFCKDKDENCKLELEAQKSKLIEMKLKQSIERIEKGKEPGKETEDDSGTNLNALRQALTGTTAGAKKTVASVTKGATQPPAKKGTTGGSSPDCDAKKNEQLGQQLDNRDEQLKLANDESALQLARDSCSSAEEDDDDDIEDEIDSQEEFCDTCLQERLETIISREDVKTSETSCQTEMLTPPPPSTPPKAPAGPMTTKLRSPAPKEAKRRLSTGDVSSLRQSGDGSETARTGSKWTAEKEAELLDLITLESRASLDSIRDTLERLVHLAQDGDVPPGLEMDLAHLKNFRAEQLKQRSLEPPMDVIEIPPLPETDVVDLGDVDGGSESGKKSTKKETLGAALKQRLEDVRQSESPAPSDLADYSDEEYALIRHAKQIVENKAEELVTKYSQLIEQSEATRLAETVKKVEKRMKDIEKQTMTCRKELADECDRHFKEEQKLLKNTKQLQAAITASNEKSEKLNAQLKERKNEIKRLEKRLKAEGQMSAENAELQARIETLEKDVASLQKRLADEQKKHQREVQSLLDSKKHLQQELTVAESDVERLNTQVDEKTQNLRKAENRFDQERKQTASSLKEALERAKKAEVNLLEFKLEIGIKLLVRAQEDCQNNIKQLDDMAKRARHQQEVESLRKFMAEWQRTRDEIGKLIAVSKSDFGAQIEAVKAGKQLSHLPVLEVSKPPPPPKAAPPTQPPPIELPAHNTYQQYQQDALKQPPTPIGARPANAAGSASVPGTPLSSNGPLAPSSAGNNHFDGTMPPINLPSQRLRTPPPNQNPNNPQQQQQQQQQQHAMTAPTVNGFSPWSDPLNNLAETLLASRSAFGHLGGGGFGSVTSSSNGWTDTWGSSAVTSSTPQPPPGVIGGPAASALGNGHSTTPSAIGAAYQHQQQQQQQQQQSAPSQMQQQQQQQPAPGQWGVGWGYQQVTSAPQQPPSPPSSNAHDTKIRPLSRGLASSPNTSGLMDSRGSSPITAQNERHKRVEALMDQLRATFPSITQDVLREYVNEYRNQRPNRTLKGLSVEMALKGVVSLIMNKQAGWNKQNSVHGATTLQSMTMDTFAQAAPAGGDVCTACRDSLRGSKVIGLKCRHRFHANCVKDWLASQQTCPSCGKFSPSPEEYPEL